MNNSQTFLFESPAPPPAPARRGAKAEDLERKARRLGDDPFALKEALDAAAIRMLTEESRRLLSPWTFEFEKRRLVSAHRTVALQWRAETNPATAEGAIVLEFLPINPGSGFDLVPSLPARPARPARKGKHPRSQEAYEANVAGFTKQERRILEWLEAKGTHGGTAAEATEELRLSISSTSARFADLKRKGGIVETKLTRLTPWNNRATVCVVPAFLDPSNAKGASE